MPAPSRTAEGRRGSFPLREKKNRAMPHSFL
ncbi:MAG: hypothetical protein J5861_04445 [Desulfovibrio sp.]|nr:hypothetical protein [Desulfovibrio sp.]